MSDEKEELVDEHKIIAERRAKLSELRELGNPYPNDFRRDAYAADVHAQYGDRDKEQFEEDENVIVRVAGRMMLQRVMGKASFITLQDMSGRIQCYLRKNDLPEGVYNNFKRWDLGDFIGVSGNLFRTNTGELSIHVDELRLLSKSLRPLPDKHKGLTDQELRYRQRYVDLMVNEKSRRTFEIRSKMILVLRELFAAHRYLEVETPMMQVIPGGAAARPFVTHHNALDMDLYLRIAPELYLKRLVVGGFERVYEINRNFRNEGLSTRHNPEFTMLEFYRAYADYQDLMDFTEVMLRTLAERVLGSMSIVYQGVTLDFAQPFSRITVFDSILKFNPDLQSTDIDNLAAAERTAESMGIALKADWGLGKVQIEIFEKSVEHRLEEPTFITEYPTEVSPLARRNDQNPEISDRFEFFVAGYEIANGFSELNDPEDQAERFLKQSREKEAGDEEAMHYDADYIRALEYGMPPTAGEGIGIDRLVMLFTDSASIRDVLLFPHMKPEVHS